MELSEKLAKLTKYGDTLTKHDIADVRGTSPEGARTWTHRRGLTPIGVGKGGLDEFAKEDVEAALRKDHTPDTFIPRAPRIVDDGR